MIDLGHIVSGKEEPYKIVEKINWFKINPRGLDKPFKGTPCLYELPDYRTFICDKSEIVKANYDRATSKIGELFRIPNEYVETI